MSRIVGRSDGSLTQHCLHRFVTDCCKCRIEQGLLDSDGNENEGVFPLSGGRTPKNPLKTTFMSPGDGALPLQSSFEPRPLKAANFSDEFLMGTQVRFITILLTIKVSYLVLGY